MAATSDKDKKEKRKKMLLWTTLFICIALAVFAISIVVKSIINDINLKKTMSDDRLGYYTDKMDSADNTEDLNEALDEFSAELTIKDEVNTSEELSLWAGEKFGDKYVNTNKFSGEILNYEILNGYNSYEIVVYTKFISQEDFETFCEVTSLEFLELSDSLECPLEFKYINYSNQVDEHGAEALNIMDYVCFNGALSNTNYSQSRISMNMTYTPAEVNAFMQRDKSLVPVFVDTVVSDYEAGVVDKVYYYSGLWLDEDGDYSTTYLAYTLNAYERSNLDYIYNKIKSPEKRYEVLRYLAKKQIMSECYIGDEVEQFLNY